MRSKKAHISKSSRIRVGITIGDPSGIGAAITLKAIRQLRGWADFTLIGAAGVFKKLTPAALPPTYCRFIDLDNLSLRHFTFGRIKAEYGRAAIEYLDTALELLNQGMIDCLVTSPISKEAINLAGFPWPGHTEYLAQKTKTRDFAMMLLNDRIKTVLVTRHLPLKDVAAALSRKKIVQAALLADKYLKKLFGLSHPRLIVCGLNPHASDNGLLGREEGLMIKPALAYLRRKNVSLTGPLPADIASLKAAGQECDCLIAMYHDQALIPLKLTGAGSGVNLTLGLPFVRTSPLHGTAFDIAGQLRLANADSMVAAIKLAIRCTLNQRKA